jgi:peptidoglycan/LPS O-acetylase OafA/YrhL
LAVNIMKSDLPPPNSERLPALDGVRGLAVMIVLAGHAANRGLLPKVVGLVTASQGVMLFFVLSGFLMTYLYANRPFSGPEVRRYASHRVGRVLPLYFAVVVVCWLFSSGANPLQLYRIDTATFIRDMLFVSDSPVLWTVSVEIQFYLLFLALWWSVRCDQAWAGVVGLMVAGLAAAAMCHAYSLSAEHLPFWLHFFVVGAAIALVWPTLRKRIVTLRQSTAVTASLWLALALAVLLMPPTRNWLQILPPIAPFRDPLTIASTLILFCGALVSAGPFRILAWRPVQWIGDISFAVYLFHLPVIMLLRPLCLSAQGRCDTGSGIAVFALACAVLFVLAAASLYLFERPMRRLIAQWGAPPAVGATRTV